MNVLTPKLRTALRANDIIRRSWDPQGKRFDPVPLVKFFNPRARRRGWRPNSARMAIPSSASPTSASCAIELGSFSLREIASVRLPLGLFIERDVAFETSVPLSTWAQWSRRAGSILHAEALLRRAARSGASSENPLPPDELAG